MGWADVLGGWLGKETSKDSFQPGSSSVKLSFERRRTRTPEDMSRLRDDSFIVFMVKRMRKNKRK